MASSHYMIVTSFCELVYNFLNLLEDFIIVNFPTIVSDLCLEFYVIYELLLLDN
jgi:hypothetical protein